MTRIIAALRSNNNNKKVKNPKTTNSALSGSFHDPAELTRRTRVKRKVRTLAAPFTGQQGGPGVTYAKQGGSTNWKSSPAADGLTDNPNPKFDPSPHPGSVSVKKVEANRTRKGTSGHAKVIDNPTAPSSVRGQKIKKR